MKAIVNIGADTYEANLNEPIDISIPLLNSAKGPRCFYAPPVSIEPVVSGEWIGSTAEGSPVNFKNLMLNPHGNGTHTECVGHISSEEININSVLKQSFFPAQLYTIRPILKGNGDQVISYKMLRELNINSLVSGLIIRTQPNVKKKLVKDYSDTNPPYFDHKGIEYLNKVGIEHLLIDLPSVDKEYDKGRLASHKAFWDYPATCDSKKTITEMIFVNNNVKDGLYLCDIQIINLAMDASPSRPLLFKLKKSEI